MGVQTIPPTFRREAHLWREGHTVVAGLDEAGRGALAGPVTAAAVAAPFGSALTGVWSLVRDSKQLTPSARTELANLIRGAAAAWSVAHVEAEIIDAVGIAVATRQAMAAAAARLTPAPSYLLIDWVKLPTLNIAQESFAKADQISASVAAASILAKVARDERLQALDAEHPVYGFAANKGYGSQAHRDALLAHGPSPVHRFSFAPMATQPTLFDVNASAAGR